MLRFLDSANVKATEILNTRILIYIKAFGLCSALHGVFIVSNDQAGNRIVPLLFLCFYMVLANVSLWT